jgi:hypothetical protein
VTKHGRMGAVSAAGSVEEANMLAEEMDIEGDRKPLLDLPAEFKAEIINEEEMDIEGDRKPLQDLLTEFKKAQEADEGEVGLGNMLADTMLSNIRDEVKEEVKVEVQEADEEVGLGNMLADTTFINVRDEVKEDRKVEAQEADEEVGLGNMLADIVARRVDFVKQIPQTD